MSLPITEEVHIREYKNMTIEIKNVANRAISSQGSGKPASAVDSDRPSHSSSAKSSTSSDRVSLTASATQLAALEEQIGSLPIVDINRVAETRHALATGAHQINPESTADNLLATERAFAQKS